MKTVVIDGVEYREVPEGNRYLVMLGRYNMFVGDLIEDDHRTYLYNACAIHPYYTPGTLSFQEMLNFSANKQDVTKLMSPVSFPLATEVFRFKVEEDLYR